MKAPVCSLNTPVATQQRTPPTGSKKAQSTEEYFTQVAREGGVLNTAQQLEIGLQKDFVTGVSNMASAVPVLGNYNRVESAMATLLGWKRWLWQSVSQGTDAGLAREALFERSMQASEMVRMLAIQKSLPDIQKLYTTLVNSATNVPATRLQELLHDQIIVGNANKLLNVVDSPLVLERLHQRYMKHQANLDEIGLSPAIKQQLEDLSVRISNTFDETRYAAGQSGFAIDSIENGGYFPIRVTEEFGKLLDKSGEQWLSGFKPLKEVMQRQRRTNMPVVVDLDHMTTLLQSKLLNRELGGESLAAMGEQELKIVGEQAAKAQDTIAEIRVSQRAAQAKATEEATKSLAYKQKLAQARARDLLEARNRAVLAKESANLKKAVLTPDERKATLAAREAELGKRTQATLDDISSKWDARAARKQEQLEAKYAKETEKKVARAEAEVEATRVAQDKAKVKAMQDATKELSDKQRQAMESTRQVMEARAKTELTKEQGNLKLSSYTGDERKAILAAKREELAKVTKDAVDVVAAKWEKRIQDSYNRVEERFAKETERLVAKATEEVDAVKAASATELAKAKEAATKLYVDRQKQAVAKAKDLLDAKAKTTLTKEGAALKTKTYSPAERKAALDAKKAELDARTQSTLADITTVWEERAKRKAQQLDTAFAKETDTLVERSLRSQSKEVQSVLEFEKAKLRLLEINANPGELSAFLSSNFSEGQLKRLFEGGFLAQMPAMSDELLEFYRGLDLGVRGLSDAIIMNPVEAIRGYADELAKAAGEQMMFKTAFDMGAEAGWVKAAITPEEAANYIKVGNNPMLAKYLPNSGLTAEVSDLWIHKTAAGQLDALMKINTSPAELNSAAQSFNMFTSFTRKSLITQGGLGYVKRVFVQNIISLYASTGSLAQLPFAIVDTMRAMSNLSVGDNAAKVFKIGNTSYSVPELMREVALRRGGYTAESMNDPRNLTEALFTTYGKEARERANHFNAVYANKYGEPMTGNVSKFTQGVGDAFNKAYGFMAFANATLDNAARWAAVRELASTGKYDNLDTLLRELDTYFSINADGGSIGKALGSSYMPFAQFAINAPGAALRHAINHPWRTANVMQLYSQASQSNSLTEAELPPWMRESKDYFFSAYRDPETGKHGVVMPQNVDFMLDSYTWMTSLARDLAGSPQSVTDYISQESNPAAKVQKAFADIISKNYLANAGLALMGIDPKSLKPFDNSAPADTLLGVSTPIGIRTMITNLVPIIRKLDQSLPASIVGRAPTKTELVGGVKTFADPGVPSIFGNTPTTGGNRSQKNMPALATLFEGLTGITVTEIDPQQNVISTYKDFNTKLKEIHTNRMELYRKLVLTNAAPTSAEYQRFDHLKQLEIVLGTNKARIDLLAARKGLTSPVLYEQLQGNFNELLTMPIDNDTQQQMLQILQENPNE